MSILEQILASKALEVEQLKPREAELRKLAAGRTSARQFAAALRAGDNVALVAEFKRRSPSAGWIREDGMVAETTKAYNDAGARAISILTDEVYFAGSLSDLETAREKTSVPILRKDFVIHELQILQARAAGADAVLLIVRALDDLQLRDFIKAANEVGLDTLVETHDEVDVERALAANAQVIGINNRDLSSFRVDQERTRSIVTMVPPNVVLVAESGIRNAEDVARFGAAGVDAVLVGEALMRAADTVQAVRAMSTQPRARRA